MEQSIAFYSRVLGFEVDTRVKSGDGKMDIVHLKKCDDYLELFCHVENTGLPDFAGDNASDIKVVGTKHVAFGTDEPEKMHAYLRAQGVAGLTPIFDNNPYYKYFFFRDPDGIAIEVVSRRP